MKQTLLISLFFLYVTSLSIQKLDVSGTHKEIGVKIGSYFKTNIEYIVDNYPSLNKVLLPFFNTQQGQIIVQEFIDIHRKVYPQLFEEILGISQGSEIPFYKLILLNLRSELLQILRGNVAYPDEEECSDIHINSDNVIIGHNEDADATIKDHAFLINVTITEGDGEQFLAYTYPGFLPGNAFGFNKFLTFSLNAVFPKVSNATVGLGRNFINRDLFRAKTFDEAIQLATPEGRSSCGFSLNLGSIAEKRSINVEVDQYHYSVTQSQGNFSHFNMYKVLGVPQVTDLSTIHRQARVDDLPIPKTITDVKEILGDTGDKDYPIYRTSQHPDSATTVATCIFDLTSGTANIWTSNPKDSDSIASFDLH